VTRRLLPFALLFAAALLALAAAASGWPRAHHTGRTQRALLLDPTPEGDISPFEAQSLGSLLMDALETRTDLAVTNLSKLPEPYQPEGDLLLLRPRMARTGVNLSLSLEWAELGPGRDGAWHTAAPGPGAPDATIEAAVDALPVEASPANLVLLPRDPERFWELLKADSAVYSNVGLDDALALGQRLAGEEPGCAAIQASIAHLDTIRILQNPQPLDGRVDLALAAADKALALLPGYPRALRFAARLLSDQGRQDEALNRLQDGLRLHPRSLNLLLALDYAARTAGLLDIALGARERMAALWTGAPVAPPTGFTYLYAGRLEAFETSLPTRPGVTPDGFTAFNLGYAALIRGRREEAARRFQEVEQDAAAEDHFRALAKVFRFQIEGRTADARQALDLLDRSRMGLQVPDGEFTFTMAEAAAFLGEEGLAMDLSQRAFSQGFVCAAWYRGSPFMAALQPLPRWQSILQHVDERQGRLAALHQPRDFGL
jgi:tetratricopeptide (TPR) repeat protein